ncbi:hypothetical protein BGX26_009099 [Mortierella sp. AD094]|nr:hypothetical protein BGX26_009099 [Mortierella sp. AD094]
MNPNIIQLTHPVVSDPASLQTIISTLRNALDKSIQEADILRKQNEDFKKQVNATAAVVPAAASGSRLQEENEDEWSTTESDTSSESNSTNKRARGDADGDNNNSNSESKNKRNSESKGKGKTIQHSIQSNLYVRIVAADGAKYRAKISGQTLQEYPEMVIHAMTPCITLKKRPRK